MRDLIADRWRKISLRRHQSELTALRLARKIGIFAIFPIFGTVVFWWFAFCLPILLLSLPGFLMVEFGTGTTSMVLGFTLQILSAVLSMTILFAAAPWFFRWYIIAAGLMLGRTGMADKKETELIATLQMADIAL